MKPLEPIPNELKLVPLPDEIICYHIGCTTNLATLITEKRTAHCTRIFNHNKAWHNIIKIGNHDTLRMTDAEIDDLNKYLTNKTCHTIVFNCTGCHQQVSYPVIESTGEIQFPKKYYDVKPIVKTINVEVTNSVPLPIVPQQKFQHYDPCELLQFHVVWYPQGIRF